MTKNSHSVVANKWSITKIASDLSSHVQKRVELKYQKCFIFLKNNLFANDVSQLKNRNYVVYRI